MLRPPPPPSGPSLPRAGRDLLRAAVRTVDEPGPQGRRARLEVGDRCRGSLLFLAPFGARLAAGPPGAPQGSALTRAETAPDAVLGVGNQRVGEAVQPHVAACAHLLGRSRLYDRRFVSLTRREEQLGPRLPARRAAAPAARVEEEPGPARFEAQEHRSRSLLDEDALARALLGSFAHRVLVAVGDRREAL